MTLEEVKRSLETRTSGWGAEIKLVSTGAGPFLYLAVDAGQERKVLGLRLEGDTVVADVCGEDSGRLYSEKTTIADLSDLDPLFELLPKPWMTPIATTKGLERLETK